MTRLIICVGLILLLGSACGSSESFVISGSSAKSDKLKVVDSGYFSELGLQIEKSSIVDRRGDGDTDTLIIMKYLNSSTEDCGYKFYFGIVSNAEEDSKDEYVGVFSTEFGVIRNDSEREGNKHVNLVTEISLAKGHKLVVNAKPRCSDLKGYTTELDN